jgi:chemotaxis protein MotB
VRTLKQLEERFRKLIDAGNLEVVNFNGRLIIKLKANILFDPGRVKVRDEGVAALRDVAAVLSQFSNRHFQVAGHTDDDPVKRSGFTDNWELSAMRAVAWFACCRKPAFRPRCSRLPVIPNFSR